MGKKAASNGCGGFGGLWLIFGLMYIFTSDTVEPFGKLEFFWRMLAGPFNFLPWLWRERNCVRVPNKSVAVREWVYL